MALTATAQKLINNIKALSQPNVTILSNLLFRQTDRRYQLFAALFLGGSVKWVNFTTYASSFVNFFGTSFSNNLSNILTGSGGNTITAWTQADSDSLITEFFKADGSTNSYLRNVLYGLLTGSRAAIQSTTKYIRIRPDGTLGDGNNVSTS